jgi:hypothetical protein
MPSGRWISILIPVSGLIVCTILGCERESVTLAPAPATQPATRPATPPAEAEHDAPSVATFLINGQLIEFPPARLALRARGGQVLALLYSDDPPEALGDDYRGNSFYLEMTLDVPEIAQIGQARWEFTAPNSERADTVAGIWLDGRRQHLQPFDVAVEFEPDGPIIKTWVRGHFLLFQAGQDSTLPGQIIPVSAELHAQPVTKASRGG